jgi:glycosyltransferase involved in cell wall biosynthesis
MTQLPVNTADSLAVAGPGIHGDKGEDRRVLVLSSCFPSAVQPVHGAFIKERVRHVAQLPGTRVRVLSPIPYFPAIRWFKRWYPLSQIASEEDVDGLPVVRPRYPLPPKIGGHFHARLMYAAARRATARLREEDEPYDFDLIDAHFAYPDGVVAARLGLRYRKPVVITCRGEDIERFPELPLIGRRIRWALRAATRLVAVSRRIANRMEELGAKPQKITVIPNGVDVDKFRPMPMEQARRELGLPPDRPLVLAVGYRLELKGFHLLVDAIPRIRERYPDVLVAIVGGEARWENDFLPTIEERIRVNRVKDHVLLAGMRPPAELPNWYSAADLLAILSSREGSPNVLMEALACGLPAVATPVGGIPDVLSDPRLGALLPERSAEAAASGITEALSQTWDRAEIRRAAEGRTWHQAAQRVEEVFDRAVREYRPAPSP